MKLKITVLPGDGIGPEVVAQALATLDAVGVRYGHQFEYNYALIGAAAIDATGSPYPDQTHISCTHCDAVLLGAVGEPRFDNDPSVTVRPEQGLLKMRAALGLYANLRPITIFDELAHISPLKNNVIAGVDCLFVRELTGGIYFGEHFCDGNEARDVCTYTAMEIDRILKVGFDQAAIRRRRLTVVDKANVLATSRLWRSRAQAMGESYPNVKVEYMFVDNAAMQIASRPADFDVVVTENMFGDILTDLASVISGSIGLLPSASVGGAAALFEPIHGSWPAGAGTGRANPIATILCAAMLLEYKGLTAEGAAVRSAVHAAVQNNILTPELGGQSTTTQIGTYIKKWIQSN